MGGWPRSRQTGWEAVPWNTLRNDQMVDHEPVTKMINNGLIAHGVTLHNVGSHVGRHTDASGSDYQSYTVTPGNNKRIRKIPLRGLVTGASGELRVWVRASRADGASSAFISATVGREFARVDVDGAAGTFDWYLISVPLTFNRAPNLETTDVLEVWVGCDWDYPAGDTVQVYGVGIHEGYDHKARPWRDTTVANCKIGQPDYPWSPAMERVEAYKLSAIRGHRMPRCNVHQQCHIEGTRAIGAAFSANEDEFGRYIIRKPEATTQIDAVYWARGQTPAGAIDVRLGLWSLESVNYTGQTSNFTDGDILVGQTSGARARILAVNDAGATGAVLVGPITGTFQAAENLVGEKYGGDGVVGGTPLGGSLQVTHTTTAHASGLTWPYYAVNIGSLISEDCEYELRIDIKRSGAGTSTQAELFEITLADHLDTDVAHVLPSPKHAEEDDDVRAATVYNLDRTLAYLWARRRQILLHDYRPETGGQHAGKQQTYNANYTHDTTGTFSAGVINASQDVRYLVARATVRKPTLEKKRRLGVTGVAGGPIAIGDVVTGGTSGATATVLWARTILGSGNITVIDSTGDFISGEALTFAGSGATATASSALFSFDSSIQARLAIVLRSTIGAAVYRSHEIDCTNLPRSQPVDISFRVTVPAPFWEDFSVHVGTVSSPYLWVVESITDDPSDYLILDDLDVWEEPYPQGGWRMLEHHLAE
jgi:hypothetical protein